MSERPWPEGDERGEDRTPPDQGRPAESGKTPGGVDPLTGESGEAESSNADVPAA